MRNRNFYLLFCVLIVSAVLGYMNLNQPKQDSNLLLSNIEALAFPENYNITCFGKGSIDCPISSTKVDEVYEEY